MPKLPNTDEIFDHPDGIEHVVGALRYLRTAARGSAALVRARELRDVPSHIRDDILAQSYDLMEFVGRCEAIFVFFRVSKKKGIDYELMKKIFATIFEEACAKHEDLNKLCDLVISTYTKGTYFDRAASTRKDY